MKSEQNTDLKVGGLPDDISALSPDKSVAKGGARCPPGAAIQDEDGSMNSRDANSTNEGGSVGLAGWSCAILHCAQCRKSCIETVGLKKHCKLVAWPNSSANQGCFKTKWNYWVDCAMNKYPY